MLSEIQVERYSRQIILPQVGGRGQLALLAATVAMCGSGELATTAALYLAGAGVGHLRLSPEAAATIEGLNPDCHVAVLTSAAATDVSGAGVVLCAAAGAVAGAPIYAAALASGIPVIVGEATTMAGWMSTCAGAPCYTCLTGQWGAADADAEAPLGTVAAGFIGTLLATEAIKIMLGLAPSAVGRRVTFDALGGDVRSAPTMSDPQCAVCSGGCL